MLSNFQVTTSVWPPERLTVDFEASENDRPLVEHEETSASHVATSTKLLLLNVPLFRTAFTQAPPPPFGVDHDTSLADQVVAPATGGVNDAAAAMSDTLSCLLAVARTMLSTVTLTALADVFAFTFVTLKLTPAGTVILACSGTLAVSVVVCPVFGSETVVCALAGTAQSSRATASNLLMTVTPMSYLP